MSATRKNRLSVAVMRYAALRQDLLEAQAVIEIEAARFHGIVPVRAIARETGLSACTVSDFFRGRLKVSAANALRLARIAEREGAAR